MNQVINKVGFADAALLAGFCAAGYGFWLAWHPLGFIVDGVALVFFGFLYERASVVRRRNS